MGTRPRSLSLFQYTESLDLVLDSLDLGPTLFAHDILSTYSFFATLFTTSFDDIFVPTDKTFKAMKGPSRINKGAPQWDLIWVGGLVEPVFLLKRKPVHEDVDNK